MTPIEVRSDLVSALQLDLVGPMPASPEAAEVLSQAPSRWYLTGFLVSANADESQRSEPAGEDAPDQQGTIGGTDDSVPREPAAARKLYFPSSMGLSCLVRPDTTVLHAVARWGDYQLVEQRDAEGRRETTWPRRPREVAVELVVAESIAAPRTVGIPGANGLELVVSVRPVTTRADSPAAAPQGTRAVSVFVVNRRPPEKDLDKRDQASVFQAELELHCEHGFVPRENLRGFATGDWDERVADLQYRDVRVRGGARRGG